MQFVWIIFGVLSRRSFFLEYQTGIWVHLRSDKGIRWQFYNIKPTYLRIRQIQRLIKHFSDSTQR